jgi:hypothetical protein
LRRRLQFRDRHRAHFYTVHRHIWLSVEPDSDRRLCLDCLQARLGRPLTVADFVATPFSNSCRALSLAPSMTPSSRARDDAHPEMPRGRERGGSRGTRCSATHDRTSIAVVAAMWLERVAAALPRPAPALRGVHCAGLPPREAHSPKTHSRAATQRAYPCEHGGQSPHPRAFCRRSRCLP